MYRDKTCYKSVSVGTQRKYILCTKTLKPRDCIGIGTEWVIKSSL